MGKSNNEKRGTVDWPAIREAFEETTLPVTRIADEFGVSRSLIYNRKKSEGWVRCEGATWGSRGKQHISGDDEATELNQVRKIQRKRQRQAQKLLVQAGKMGLDPESMLLSMKLDVIRARSLWSDVSKEVEQLAKLRDPDKTHALVSMNRASVDTLKTLIDLQTKAWGLTEEDIKEIQSAVDEDDQEAMSASDAYMKMISGNTQA